MTSDLIVDVANLHFSYRNGAVVTPVLHGVDLQIRRGEFVVIVGPSGCGKTTLLHVLGLMAKPNRADRLTICGEDALAMKEVARTAVRRREIAFVFQRFNLLPVISAADNINLALRLRGVELDSQARRALEWVDLAEVADKRPVHLSIGQQQRVAIARALACHAPLLLADEPTGNLDTDNAQRVLALLQRMQREHGQTTIMITHNLAIANMADRVIRMRDGRFES